MERLIVTNDARFVPGSITRCNSEYEIRRFRKSHETAEARGATKQPAVISRLLYFPATAHRAATRVHRRQDVVRRGACNYAI